MEEVWAAAEVVSVLSDFGSAGPCSMPAYAGPLAQLLRTAADYADFANRSLSISGSPAILPERVVAQRPASAGRPRRSVVDPVPDSTCRRGGITASAISGTGAKLYCARGHHRRADGGRLQRRFPARIPPDQQTVDSDANRSRAEQRLPARPERLLRATRDKQLA